MNHKAIDRVMVALDNLDKNQVESLLENDLKEFSYIKIGLELFCAHGKDWIKEISNKYDKKIFLDLKLHDIPNTVSKAIKSLEGLDIAFLTIHLAGGRKMIEQAMISRKTYLPHTKLLGVSYLTSLENNDLKEMFGIELNDNAFTKLFELAIQTSIDGVVCSPHEASLIKKLANDRHDILTICPGVRFKDEIEANKVQDQKRVLDPEMAIKEGADYLVMGRSIIKATQLDQRVAQLSQMIL